MSEIEIITDDPPIPRVPSGLYSFDRALGNPTRNEWGMPLRIIYTIYGKEHVGKSTLAYYLAGRVQQDGNILLCDFEGVDPPYLATALQPSGFGGKLTVMPSADDKGPRFHSDMMGDTTKELLEETVSSIILDSVSAIQSIAEQEGDVGESFMGRRAFIVSQFSRRLLSSLRAKEAHSAAFIINHSYVSLGRMQFESMAGGSVLRQQSAAIIKVKRIEQGFIDGRDDFLIEGEVKKLRYGGKGRKFLVFFLAGRGVHPGVTAVFDCIRSGLADRPKGGYIKIDGKSHGRLKALIGAADAGEDEKFQPFYEVLEAQNE